MRLHSTIHEEYVPTDDDVQDRLEETPTRMKTMLFPSHESEGEQHCCSHSSANQIPMPNDTIWSWQVKDNDLSS